MRWLAVLFVLVAGVAQAGDPFFILRQTETVTVVATQSASAKLGQSHHWARVTCSVTCWVGSSATNSTVARSASSPVLLFPREVEQIAVMPNGYVMTLAESATGHAYITVIQPR